MSDLKEVNIPLAAADAEKSESLPDRKEDFAFLKLKKELKSLKFENSELRAQLGVFKDQQTEQTFLAHGGRKNAFQAFKKANADLLADPDQPIDGKKLQKDQDYFFVHDQAVSSNDGKTAGPGDNGLGNLTVETGDGKKPTY